MMVSFIDAHRGGAHIVLDADDLTMKTRAESRFKETFSRVNDELYERYISDKNLLIEHVPWE
jgi:hypothetical protein